MEKTAEILAKVDFLDIYDEISELPISNEQVAKMCITLPCKVDLRKVNLVYLVEQKYKTKLSTYDKSKTLKWLRVNLPRLLPNPEAKYQRWKERHQRKEKIEWIKRKAHAIQQLPPPISGSQNLSIQIENYDDSREGNKTQQTNSTAATMETVIPSQKSVDEIMAGFLDLIEASYTTIDSNDLPTPFSNNVSSTQAIDVEPMRSPKINKNVNSIRKHPPRKLAIQLSEGFSSQDDCYTSFNLENIVTSTQEFD